MLQQTYPFATLIGEAHFFRYVLHGNRESVFKLLVQFQVIVFKVWLGVIFENVDFNIIIKNTFINNSYVFMVRLPTQPNIK